MKVFKFTMLETIGSHHLVLVAVWQRILDRAKPKPFRDLPLHINGRFKSHSNGAVALHGWRAMITSKMQQDVSVCVGKMKIQCFSLPSKYSPLNCCTPFLSAPVIHSQMCIFYEKLVREPGNEVMKPPQERYMMMH